MRSRRGITLIALVVTIIILIILAGVSINVVLGENGIINMAKRAKEDMEIAVEEEQAKLDNLYMQMDDEAAYSEEEKVNVPMLLTGMRAIKFTDPEEDAEGEVIKTTSSDKEWYNYEAKKWANSQTQDGSMWVWIPRYAYKITYYTDDTKTTVSETKTSYSSIDVKFLIGKTDKYYKEDGTIGTAQRQKTVDETIDTTADYTVHPAFTNEKSINYANGGWREELTGIWVAKFEAGYASGNNNAPVKASSVKYTEPRAWVSATETKTSESRQGARNWLDGIYSKIDENGTMTYGSTKYSWTNGEVAIKYPTFQGLTYSMNYINNNDSYNISKVLTESGNIYGLSTSDADSHLIKNSEWGAVAYLSQSQYGLDGTNIYINNVSLNNSITSVYAVTGMAGSIENAAEVTTTIKDINEGTVNNVYTWKEENGIKASTTGTIYGIYDFSGGLWERTASFVSNGHANLNSFGSSLLNGGENTEYTIIYPSDDLGQAVVNTASEKNYEANTKIYGDAVREISTKAIGTTLLNNDYLAFPGDKEPFLHRSGRYSDTWGAGLFYLYRTDGSSLYQAGFRTVLVAKY